MKIAIGSDHGGYLLKEEIKNHLLNKGYEVEDVGTYSKESCHYPEFGIKAAELVAQQECDYGVLVCTTGEGITMAANKVLGIRCGIGYNDEVAKMMRQHNNANIIAFGASYTTPEEANRRVDIFLNTEFEGGRHQVRVGMIEDYEKK